MSYLYMLKKWKKNPPSWIQILIRNSESAAVADPEVLSRGGELRGHRNFFEFLK